MTANTTATPRGSELLPCPFCGGEPEVLGEFSTKVRCTDDQCVSRIDSGGYNFHDHRNSAITAWNTRAAIESAAAPGMGGDEIPLAYVTDLDNIPWHHQWASIQTENQDARDRATKGSEPKEWWEVPLTRKERSIWAVGYNTAVANALATHPTPTVAPIPAAAEGVTLPMILWAMRNWADVADRCAVTEGHAPSCIRSWADQIAALSKPDAGAGVVDAVAIRDKFLPLMRKWHDDMKELFEAHTDRGNAEGLMLSRCRNELSEHITAIGAVDGGGEA